MKKLLVVLDGIGDLPCKALGGRTPLEAARKPNLDFLASRAKTGCINIAGKSAPESDGCFFGCLGFSPLKQHVGRGVLEALGVGMVFENGWLALRANFSTTDESGKKLVDRRVGRNLSTPEAKHLEEEINSKVKLSVPFVFKSTVSHRGVLVLETRGVSKKISNTDPAYAIRGGLADALRNFEMKIAESRPLENSDQAKKAAALVNEFTRKAHAVLQKSSVNARRTREGKLPANAILLRDAETALAKIRNTAPKFHKMRWALLADMPLEVGIARFLGMTVVKPPTP